MVRTHNMVVPGEIYPDDQAASFTGPCVHLNGCSLTVQISSQGTAEKLPGENKVEVRVSGRCARNKKRRRGEKAC